MKKLKAFLPIWFKNLLKDLFDGWAVKSYSQEGEDRILGRLFEKAGAGFYVDVGAHHPKRFSNTYFFYKRGWRGINIDAMPGSMNRFRRARPRDINVEVAVAQERKELIFYLFNDPALNTFDVNLARKRSNATYRVISEKKVCALPLKDILTQHVPSGTQIDFMSIDVEGLDLEVARSNDWTLFRPIYVLLESYNTSLDRIDQDELYKFMSEQQYVLVAKTYITLIFKDARHTSAV